MKNILKKCQDPRMSRKRLSLWASNPLPGNLRCSRLAEINYFISAWRISLLLTLGLRRTMTLFLSIIPLRTAVSEALGHLCTEEPRPTSSTEKCTVLPETVEKQLWENLLRKKENRNKDSRRIVDVFINNSGIQD